MKLEFLWKSHLNPYFHFLSPLTSLRIPKTIWYDSTFYYNHSVNENGSETLLMFIVVVVCSCCCEIKVFFFSA